MSARKVRQHGLDRRSGLERLLAQSSPSLFDRVTMAPHLGVLTRLLQQTRAYELQAGLDLYHDPLTMVQLLQQAGHSGGC